MAILDWKEAPKQISNNASTPRVGSNVLVDGVEPGGFLLRIMVSVGSCSLLTQGHYFFIAMPLFRHYLSSNCSCLLLLINMWGSLFRLLLGIDLNVVEQRELLSIIHPVTAVI